MSSYPTAPTSGFEQIARAMRQAVSTGAWNAGARLPSIAELARRHGATPVTVRRALRELEAEGLVEVRHGVGTFVADWSRRYDHPTLGSFQAELAARSLGSETRLLGRLRGVRQPEAAVALGRDAAHPLACAHRLRRVEGLPFAVQYSYLPQELAGVIDGLEETGSLYDLLRRVTGRLPVRAEERLRVEPLPAEASRVLEVAPGSQGLWSRRLTRDSLGSPLVYDEAWFPAERVELRMVRGQGEGRVEYALAKGAGGGE